jgi:hypothetical protein
LALEGAGGGGGGVGGAGFSTAMAEIVCSRQAVTMPLTKDWIAIL